MNSANSATRRPSKTSLGPSVVIYSNLHTYTNAHAPVLALCSSCLLRAFLPRIPPPVQGSHRYLFDAQVEFRRLNFWPPSTVLTCHRAPSTHPNLIRPQSSSSHTTNLPCAYPATITLATMSEIINTEPPAHRTTEPILNGPPLEVVIHPSAQEPMEVWTTLTFIWAGQTYVTELAESDR
ncbi:hypothetical protein BOTBODRAFT_345547 [Botryobasidium botryosum FD-172 SS1]|uniref:Uncharacterized protein n=1 Tax=Botryobasidium botryosum (strain FD-172 SS1) TaxID=930990 RepID=A0A067MFH7_BOTB1|nr:hypothetical protein BOTBODRAFT_345547 [Botryobasidium botryosum FD-172 SS1]